jgi:hypothetical protein
MSTTTGLASSQNGLSYDLVVLRLLQPAARLPCLQSSEDYGCAAVGKNMAVDNRVTVVRGVSTHGVTVNVHVHHGHPLLKERGTLDCAKVREGLEQALISLDSGDSLSAEQQVSTALARLNLFHDR